MSEVSQAVTRIPQTLEPRRPLNDGTHDGLRLQSTLNS